jgi:hypothetical protein
MAGPARGAARHAPLLEICDVEGGQSLCANRQGGGQGVGTNVIAWSAGDNNNDFAWNFLTEMCNHGRVSETPPCPFPSSGSLNTRYNGAWIASIVAFNEQLCVADSGTGSGATTLGTCPLIDGNNGANGTIFILPQAENPMNPATTYAVNRYWSDALIPGGGRGTSPRWLCVIGKGLFLIENSSVGASGTCQWNEI